MHIHTYIRIETRVGYDKKQPTIRAIRQREREKRARRVMMCRSHRIVYVRRCGVESSNRSVEEGARERRASCDTNHAAAVKEPRKEQTEKEKDRKRRGETIHVTPAHSSSHSIVSFTICSGLAISICTIDTSFGAKHFMPFDD